MSVSRDRAGASKACRATVFAVLGLLLTLLAFAVSPAHAENILGQLPSRPVQQAALPDAGGYPNTAETPSSDVVPPLPAGRPMPGGPGGYGGGLQKSVVSSVRVGDQGARSRLVVELAGAQAVPYHVFTLADPYRVVVDFTNAGAQLPESRGEKGLGVILDYRYGRFEDNTFRVVIDATGPVKVASNFVLEPQGGFGRRVVLDLEATDRASFMASAGLPGQDKAAVKAETSAALTSPPPRPAPDPTVRQDRRRVVVIDPGHGGVDPGTHGRSGIEKDVVLTFSKELAKRLRETGRYEVHMTRDKDIFIPLRERVRIARSRKADLFISIHADSIARSDVSGMSVYTLSETASDKEAAELAKKENLSDAIAGIDFKGESAEVTGILIDLVQRETKNYSVRFAKSVVAHAKPVTSVLDPTHRFAGFVVLKAADVPSVLVELGFLTNKADEKRLLSPAWRKTVSGALLSAIDRYFGERMAEGAN